jgi:hypothetical protein
MCRLSGHLSVDGMKDCLLRVHATQRDRVWSGSLQGSTIINGPPAKFAPETVFILKDVLRFSFNVEI